MPQFIPSLTMPRPRANIDFSCPPGPRLPSCDSPVSPADPGRFLRNKWMRLLACPSESCAIALELFHSLTPRPANRKSPLARKRRSWPLEMRISCRALSTGSLRRARLTMRFRLLRRNCMKQSARERRAARSMWGAHVWDLFMAWRSQSRLWNPGKQARRWLLRRMFIRARLRQGVSRASSADCSEMVHRPFWCSGESLRQQTTSTRCGTFSSVVLLNFRLRSRFPQRQMTV